MDAFQKLKQFFGTNAAICRHYNVSRETVRLWGKRGLPNDRALDFERDTNGAVTIRDVLESSGREAN